MHALILDVIPAGPKNFPMGFSRTTLSVPAIIYYLFHFISFIYWEERIRQKNTTMSVFLYRVSSLKESLPLKKIC